MTERPASGDWPTVPEYEILGELGRGGMGVVYRARQRSTQRLVALKLIRDASLAGPRERARFRIEVEAAARMRHPNIVAILDVGEHQGRPYFAMELIEGGSLDRYLAGRPQPIAPAAELIRTLARAIQHAHERKIVHRDLKPANILLSAECGVRGAECVEEPRTPHSALRTPKIADFGLAKRLDSDSTAWTQEGAVLGTAGYLAPEQAAGRTSAIGPAVDVYALGAILYELLTGRLPFRGETWNQMLDQVLHDEPAPPTRLRADAPRDLESICLKCLEKEPAARYAGAGELADDLGRFLEGKPVTAAPPGALQRLTRRAARDGYEIAGEIGRGPRSTVYRALYGPVRQVVAVKVFAEGVYSRDEWEARLRRHAEVAATLAHPQVVAVQRGGWWDGFPYLALDYLPQGSLAARLADPVSSARGRGKARAAEALRLVEQLAAIVSYLHRQGVVHGNLKPSNVLLAADDIPRLTDLRPAGGLFQGSPHLEDAEPAGLGYLAPEVIRNPAAEPRPHTDVYGLGLILYELLTGRPPFAAATAQEMLEQVTSADPTPPSQLNAQVTAGVEACCLRCLGKDPWRRYPRAYDVLTRLEYFRNE